MYKLIRQLLGMTKKILHSHLPLLIEGIFQGPKVLLTLARVLPLACLLIAHCSLPQLLCMPVRHLGIGWILKMLISLTLYYITK